MPNIGPLELAIVAIIALIIFGPKRLPELGRSLGDGLREFKSSISGEERDDDDDDDEDDVPLQIENEVDDEQGDEKPVPIAAKPEAAEPEAAEPVADSPEAATEKSETERTPS